MSANLDGGYRFAEKDPENGFLVPFPAAEFPGAQFVHIVRDSRDSAVSNAEQPWLAGRRRAAKVRYEDMVSNPSAIADMLADFLELAPASRAELHSSPARARPDSVGRWRRALGERELADVVAEIGPLLARLGYT